MNETTPDKSITYDDVVTYDWERPMASNSMFSKIERDIIVACISIALDENHFGSIDFVCMFGSGAKPAFAKIIEKLKTDTDLDKVDGYYIVQAVLQVSASCNDELERHFEAQFGLKVYQLSWFPSYIQNGFAIHGKPDEEEGQV